MDAIDILSSLDQKHTFPGLVERPHTFPGLNPQPSILNPQPLTLNPQPSALSPQLPTLNPQPSTLNPQPSTLHPQPGLVARTAMGPAKKARNGEVGRAISRKLPAPPAAARAPLHAVRLNPAPEPWGLERERDRERE